MHCGLVLLACAALASGQSYQDVEAAGNTSMDVEMPWHAYVSGMQEAAFEQHLVDVAEAQALEAEEMGTRTSTAARYTTSTPATIRITTYFDATVQALGSANQTLVQTSVATAILVLQKYYKVNLPQTGNLVVSPANDCNGGQYAVPAQLKNGTGQPNTDLFIVVRANFSDSCTNAVAWAFSCFFDGTTSRPTLGYVNICPAFFDDAQFVANLQTRVSTVVHEMTHCMGFTSYFFNTVPNELLNATDAYGDTVLYINSTGTAALARSFFNCSSLVGAQLEDQGGSGSKNSHWDYRIFMGELMSPSGGYLVSNFTLGVMADLGWYAPRYYFAGPFTRGMNLGCSFHTQTCATYMANYDPGEELYCGTGSGTCMDEYTKTECSGDGFVFNKPVSCQITVNYGNMYGEDCRGSGNGGFAYDYPGSTSMCYPVSFQPSGTAVVKGACVDTACAAGAVVLVAHPVGGGASINVSCPTGSTVNLTALAASAYPHSTVLTCPTNSAVCATLTCSPACNSTNGMCIGGACVCHLEWLGSSCSTHVSQVISGNFDAYLPTVAPPPPSPPPPVVLMPSPPPMVKLDPTRPQIMLTVQTKQAMNYAALVGGTAARHLLTVTLSSYETDFTAALASLLGLPTSSINITSVTGDASSATVVFTVLPNAATSAAAYTAIAAFTSNAYNGLGTAFTTKYNITGIDATIIGTTTVTLTVGSPPPLSTPPPPKGKGKRHLIAVIAVCAGAGLLVLLTAGLIWWVYHWRSSKQVSPEGDEVADPKKATFPGGEGHEDMPRAHEQPMYEEAPQEAPAPHGHLNANGPMYPKDNGGGWHREGLAEDTSSSGSQGQGWAHARGGAPADDYYRDGSGQGRGPGGRADDRSRDSRDGFQRQGRGQGRRSQGGEGGRDDYQSRDGRDGSPRANSRLQFPTSQHHHH